MPSSTSKRPKSKTSGRKTEEPDVKRLVYNSEAGASVMLDLMTWQEVVDQLKAEGQFQMVIMFDLNGDVIATTDEAAMEKGDAIGLMKTMDCNRNTICGLFVLGNKFSCLTIDKNSVVGRAYHDVLAAYRSNNMLVCGVCPERADYSALGFIKNYLSQLNTQEDKTQTLV